VTISWRQCPTQSTGTYSLYCGATAAAGGVAAPPTKACACIKPRLFVAGIQIRPARSPDRPGPPALRGPHVPRRGATGETTDQAIRPPAPLARQSSARLLRLRWWPPEWNQPALRIAKTRLRPNRRAWGGILDSNDIEEGVSRGVESLGPKGPPMWSVIGVI